MVSIGDHLHSLLKNDNVPFGENGETISSFHGNSISLFLTAGTTFT